MSNDEIKELFDNNPNMTLKQLSRISKRSVEQLKRLLLGELK